MDRMQGTGALLAERVDQDAILNRQVQALSERMLVEIGQKPESIRGGLGLAELGDVLLHDNCFLGGVALYSEANIIPFVCQAFRIKIIL